MLTMEAADKEKERRAGNKREKQKRRAVTIAEGKCTVGKRWVRLIICNEQIK